MPGMMQDDGMKCPRCHSDKICKNGHKNGKQRFLCKDCRRQFTGSQNKPKYDEAFRTICLQAYRNGKSFREIERVYDVHHTTVISWVKQAGFDLSELARSSTVNPEQLMQNHLAQQKDTSAREAILSAALQIFTEQCYASTSLDRISAVAGIPKQVLSSYFPDKESLFSALIRQLLYETHQNLLSLYTDDNLPASPEIVLRQVAIALLTAFSEDQTRAVLIRLLIVESQRFPELAKHFVREVEKPLFDQLSTYLKFHPDVQIGDPLVATRMFVGSLMHYSLIQNVFQGEDVMHLERDRMVDGLIAGIMTHEPAKTAHTQTSAFL